MIKSTVFRAELRGATFLLGCALFGLVASFTLTLEKFHLLQNPGAAPSCSINPFISCASAISSDQAQLFGVPLTLFGIVAYAALLTLSLFLLTKSTISTLIWRAALIVAAIGLAGVHYLIIQSVFVLHMICPWCFGVWLTTPLIATALLEIAPPRSLPSWLHPVVTHRWSILAAWYGALLLLLITTFWDAWMTLL